MPKGKTKLVSLLVRQGYFPSEEVAASWVMAGQVYANNHRIDKPGALCLDDSVIQIRGYEKKFVSRGGYKLEYALQSFHVSVEGRVALDCGASTGGFTDCLLQHGCSRVFAVDVGYGQLAGKLRIDPRVVNLERTNLSSIRDSTLSPPPNLATLDLSYMSLTKAIPVVSEYLTPEADLICLVKPLFETGNADSRRTGIIAEKSEYRDSLLRVINAGICSNWTLGGAILSSIKGTNGTTEFLVHFSRGVHSANGDNGSLIEDLIGRLD